MHLMFVFFYFVCYHFLSDTAHIFLDTESYRWWWYADVTSIPVETAQSMESLQDEDIHCGPYPLYYNVGKEGEKLEYGSVYARGRLYTYFGRCERLCVCDMYGFHILEKS